VTHGVPVAGPGLAGMAIERRTGKMVHLGGRVQWEVLAEPLLGPTANQQRSGPRGFAASLGRRSRGFSC
jgi:hypothetical protein